jgi:sterol desaturase/sphingolipid hydroxylase (fatty acid hydroxylase superfamily)
VPIWTAYECLTLWMFANRYIPFVDFAQHPVYCVALMFAVPLFREVHFYLVHRLIHWPPLYRTVHRLHHLNVNPGPWSGLAMHPVEHLLYFSVILVHWIVPSNPVHALFTIVHAGLAPAPGHVGFDKVEVNENSAFDTFCYDHYLHHKHFECNYSDGVIPIDRWFGTFHDGSPESEERLQQRLQARALAKRTAR